MKKLNKRTNLKIMKKCLTLFRYCGCVLGVWIYGQLARADLPPAPDNANFQKGDYIAGIGDFVKEAVTNGVPILLAGGVIAYIYALITSFLHAKQQREWGHFSLIAIIGSVLLIIIFIVGNEAVQHFGSPNS